MNEVKLAGRLAETACSAGWPMMTDILRAEEIRHWAEVLEVIEAAGLKLVERGQ